MAPVRTLADLIFVDSPAWPTITDTLRAAEVDSRILSASQSERNGALERLQVTVASGLGAMVYNCGAILVDHGWLKLLGAGADGLPPAAVQMFENPKGPGPFEGVLVGLDVVGGCFAIHGSGLPGAAPGDVCYWAPDSLDWSTTDLGHSAFLQFAVSERLALFYSDLRWPTWESDTIALAPDQGISAYPPPWAVQGRSNGHVTRSAIALDEVVAIGFEYARQLIGVQPGAKVVVQTTTEI